MTPEQILELAQKYGTSETTARATFYLHDGSPTGETYPQIDWKFGQEDLMAFAQAVIDAEREGSDEPDGYITYIPDAGLLFTLSEPEDKTYRYDPVYRHPQRARKMTDEEITEIMLANGFTIKDGCDKLKPYVFQAVRAIERRINGEEE